MAIRRSLVASDRRKEFVTFRNLVFLLKAIIMRILPIAAVTATII